MTSLLSVQDLLNICVATDENPATLKQLRGVVLASTSLGLDLNGF